MTTPGRHLLTGLVAVLASSACGTGGTMLTEFEYRIAQGPGDLELQMKLLPGGELELLRRPGVDVREGKSIGVFRGPAAPGFLASVAKAIPSSPSSADSLPGAPVASLHYKFAGSPAVDIPAPLAGPGADAFASLSKIVDTEAARLEKTSAVRALEVQVIGLESARAVKVRLRNPGSHAVTVDWRDPAQKVLRIAGLQGNGDLEQLTAGRVDESAPATIAPKGQIEFLVPVEFPKTGQWEIRAIYEVRFVNSVDSEQVGGVVSSAPATVQAR